VGISKIDILNKRFAKRFRGYCRTEVDQLMHEAAEVIGEYAEAKDKLAERVDQLERQLEEHRRREETLRDTLVTTQRMVDELKANAQKQAQLIIEEAHAKAREILGQGHTRLAQLHEEITELKRQRTQFEVKLRSLLEGHQRLLDMEDQDQEQLEALESKLKIFQKAK
jgi:cell division initiation protein